MKRLLLLFSVIITLVYGIDHQTRAWVKNYVKNDDSTIDTTAISYADSMFIKKLISDWVDMDTVNCDTIYISGGGYTVRLTLDSLDGQHGVFDIHILSDSIDVQHAAIDIHVTTDSIDAQHGVFDIYVQTDSIDAQHGVFDISTQGDSAQYNHIVLGAGQILWATYRDSATVVWTDSIAKVRDNITIDTVTVDTLNVQHTVVDIGLLIGGGATVGKWVTRNDSLFLLVGTDSFPIPKKP